MSKKVLKLTPPSHIAENQIRIPGSKSYTNRALIMAAIADGESTLLSPSYSDDSNILIKALEKLGVEFTHKERALVVKGRGGKFLPYKGEIDVGAAGTSMRFLVSLLALSEGTDVLIKGSERMHQRPINDLVNALRKIGANIEYAGKEGCPPLRIRGSSHIIGGSISMPGHQSSQYFSSLLMVGPLLQDGLMIEVEGLQISRSYIDMTFDSLKAFDVHAKNSNYLSYYVRGGVLPKAKEYQIEGDASGASYFWGIAAIANAKIRVLNINPGSAQGDVHFPALLQRMGCKVTSGFSGLEGWIEVSGTPTLKGVNADMTLMPDTAQTLAVVASGAVNPTNIFGLSTLRIKETDRIAALHNELKTLGIDSETGDESIRVIPGTVGKGRIKTYEDHRMAMSFAMLAGRYEGIEIEEPEVVTKSFPEYWNFLKKLGIGVSES